MAISPEREGNVDGRPGDPEVEPTPGIAENAELFEFTLTDKDIAQLDQFDRTGDAERALECKWWS